ncbi:MAG: hypothetical protein ABSD98_16975 [Candidatus Korobacteraceae bacterium]|jgi:hypothetical protein
MTKWEYLIVDMNYGVFEGGGKETMRPDRINELGDEGWEAVAVWLEESTRLGGNRRVLLKRPKAK